MTTASSMECSATRFTIFTNKDHSTIQLCVCKVANSLLRFLFRRIFNNATPFRSAVCFRNDLGMSDFASLSHVIFQIWGHNILFVRITSIDKCRKLKKKCSEITYLAMLHPNSSCQRTHDNFETFLHSKSGYLHGDVLGYQKIDLHDPLAQRSDDHGVRYHLGSK